MCRGKLPNFPQNFYLLIKNNKLLDRNNIIEYNKNYIYLLFHIGILLNYASPKPSNFTISYFQMFNLFFYQSATYI